jgi:hypothetical protein
MVVNWDSNSQYSCVYVFVYHLQSCYYLKKSFLRLVSPLHPICLTSLHVVICHHFLFLQIPLGGPLSVVGRALVVHELEDDLGKGNFDVVLKTTVFTFVDL